MVATRQDAIRAYDGGAPTRDDSSTLVMVDTKKTLSVVFGLLNIVSGVETSTLVFLDQEGRPARALSFRGVFGF